MDKLNSDIIKLLTNDARMNESEIAKMVGSDETTVKARIKELEKKGAIIKYMTVVNEEVLENTVEALIEVKVSPVRERGFDEIAQYIYQFEEVKSLYLMSGGYDLAVFIQGSTLKDVARFVSEKLSVIDKVLSTATHFILKKYKIEGVTLGGEEKKRLIVQP